MFFKNASNIKTPLEKKYFLENIDLINRMIEKTKELYNLKTIELNSSKLHNELKHIGIIKSEQEIDILKEILKKDYDR